VPLRSPQSNAAPSISPPISLGQYNDIVPEGAGWSWSDKPTPPCRCCAMFRRRGYQAKACPPRSLAVSASLASRRTMIELG
jgi:hypothetical protein